MERERALAVLRAHAAELRAAGVESLSLFGSTARNDTAAADVDVAVRLRSEFSSGGFNYFWKREQLRERLAALLGCAVDVVEEPVRRARFQEQIDRDRALAF